KPVLVILDNLSTLATMEDENAAASFNPIIDLMNALKGHGAAVMVVHYANKGGGSFRGSSKIAATFESIIELTDKRPGRIGDAAFEVTWNKMRGDPAKLGRPVQVRLSKDLDGVHQWVTQEGTLGRVELVVQMVQSGEYQTAADIGNEIGLSKQRISDLKKEAIQRKLITQREWNICLRAARDAAKDSEEGVWDEDEDAELESIDF
ncbi:MAG: hypothetical protein AAFQ67_06155, partial [Pseudomonadota bacterium]